MGNKFKDIDIKNRTCYVFDDMNKIKNLDPDKIKMDNKRYKNIFIHYIGYVTVKNLKYIKINSANPLYFVINKLNRYIEENNGNQYLTLISIDESEDTLKSMKSYAPK